MLVWEIFRRKVYCGKNCKAASSTRVARVRVSELRQTEEQGNACSVLCLVIVLQMHQVHYSPSGQIFWEEACAHLAMI